MNDASGGVSADILGAALAAAQRARQAGLEGESRALLLKVLREAPPLSDAERDAAVMLGMSDAFSSFAEIVQHSGPLHAQRPQDAELAFAHSRVLWVLRRTAEAIAAIGRAIDLQPGNPQFVFWYSMYCATYGRLDEAIRAAAALDAAPALAGRYGGVLALYRAAAEKRLLTAGLDGVELVFEPVASNTQFITAGFQHACGGLGEPEELRQVAAWAPRGGTVVEVGLCVGNHFLYFGRVLQPERMIGVEANPVSAAVVERNLAHNRARDPGGLGRIPVTVHAAAAGRQAGAMVIDTHEQGAVTVPVVALDEVVAGGPPVRFLKVDVDGAELDVLAGARGLLTRDRPHLMIEVDAPNQAGFAAIMAELGYTSAAVINHGAYANHFMAPPGA